MWQLFLDDERYPVREQDFIIARTVDEAIILCDAMGCPQHVSFDHDLGAGIPTGHDFAKYLVEKDLDTGFIPANFSYYIHSANPVGKRNIDTLLKSYLKHKCTISI